VSSDKLSVEELIRKKDYENNLRGRFLDKIEKEKEIL